VDVTADIYKSGTDSSYDYTYASRFSDRASEARSEDSERSDISGSDIHEEFLINVKAKGETSSRLNKSG
jgi:hypothetical protein